LWVFCGSSYDITIVFGHSPTKRELYVDIVPAARYPLLGVVDNEIIIDNVLPTIEASSDQFVFEDELVVLDPDTFTDPGTGDTHTAAIYWGRRHRGERRHGQRVHCDDVVDAAGATEKLEASHCYQEPGIYRATV
jgi:hypothetical protein